MTEPHNRIRQAIRQALHYGPKNTPELVKATGYGGQMMGNHLKQLLRDGDISRVETTKGRYRYYIGLTAPNYKGYVPAVRNPDVARLTSKVAYSVPIRRVTFGADNGRANRVTLPAFPWELNSPVQGACDPAQPGNPTGTRSDVTTQAAFTLTQPGALNQPPATGTVMGTWLIACEGAKEIPGFPGYLVTPDGKIFGCRTNHGMRADYREMRPSTDANGYLGLTICGPSGLRRKARVHRLVAEVFVPNPEGKPCVRHMDGSKTNNAASNLAWGTYAENEADKKLHGTYDTRRTGKLTPQDRAVVPELYAQGMTHQAIAEKFKVSRPAISRLLSGRTWA